MARTPFDRENGDPRNNRFAIVDRRSFESQLFDANGNPTRVMYAFAGRMQKEVGAQGPEAQMAWAESVFNRAASRRHTLDYELRNHGNYNYWPRHQPEPGHSTNPDFINMITRVMRNGTNLSLGATGNASESVGVGRETFRARGERFGVETGDTNWWNTRFASLIRGIGRFIGDVAGAIGHVVGEVVRGVASVGLWALNGVASALNPQEQRAPHRPLATPERLPPRYTGPHQQHADRPVELRERQPQPSFPLWRINGTGRADVASLADRPESQPTHRPTP